MKSLSGRSLLGLSASLSLVALCAPPLAAQPGAMVQSVPQTGAVERLNQNLNRLSRQPTDMEALLGAGNASYEMGDAQAASGFFMRADMVNPRDGRAKLGLALVSVALKQPRDAAAYFDEAEALGARADAYMAERALTYDLTGQQDKAQRDYALALRAAPDNSDLIRGYAVSLGISGKVDEAQAALRPLLYKSDRAAWRDNTMILAMNGRTTEARKIAQTIMPRQLADAMDPYLIRLGSLTAAQKAAATHYGQFPADGLRLATVTSPPAALAAANKADAGDSTSRRRMRERIREARNQPAAPPEDSRLVAAMPHGDQPPAPVAPVQTAMVQPTPAVPARPVQQQAVRAVPSSGDDDPDGWTAAERRRAERSSLASSVPQPRPATPAKTVIIPTPAPAPVPAPAPFQPAPAPATQPVRTVAPVQGPPVDMAALAPTRTPAPAPAPTPSPAPAQSTASTPAPATSEAPQPGFTTAPVAGEPPATQPRTLAAIMAGIEVPEAERAASPQAVDLAEIAQIQESKRKAAAEKAKKDAAAKAKAEAAAKAKAEAEEKARLKANPSRNWVQIATGKDVGALAFDMRRLRKTYSALTGEDGWTAEWGATRRLLVGPYATTAKAKAVLTDLKKAGGDGFVWQSEAGETVSALSGGK